MELSSYQEAQYWKCFIICIMVFQEVTCISAESVGAIPMGYCLEDFKEIPQMYDFFGL